MSKQAKPMPKPITKMIRCIIVSSKINIKVRFNRCHQCKILFQSMRPEALYCPEELRPCKAKANRIRRTERDRAKR